MMKPSTSSVVRIGEELVELRHVGFLEDRGVGADQETGLLGRLDAVDRRVEDPLALDGDVVVLPHAVEVDVEEEACGCGLNSPSFLRMNMPLVQRMTTFFRSRILATSSPMPGIDHRLAAADRDDRGAALVDGGQAFVDCSTKTPR